MKKNLLTLLAAAVMSLAASSAFAAFADLDLIRVTYGATTEVAADLGNVQSLIASGGVNLGASGPSAGANPLYVTYYAVDSASGNIYISGKAGLGTTSNDAANTATAINYGNLNAVVATIHNSTDANYAANASGNFSSIAKSNTLSFFSTFEQGTNGNGGFGNLVDVTQLPTEITLTGAASQTQGLYFFDNSDPNATNFVQLATITTNADGTTTIGSAAATTPIPAAAYLLGSGLLGLMGIRRKNNK